MLIGTPGKLLDWGTKLRCFDLSKVEVFVLDEADVMIATQGHQDQSIRIHKWVNEEIRNSEKKLNGKSNENLIWLHYNWI